MRPTAARPPRPTPPRRRPTTARRRCASFAAPTNSASSSSMRCGVEDGGPPAAGVVGRGGAQPLDVPAHVRDCLDQATPLDPRGSGRGVVDGDGCDGQPPGRADPDAGCGGLRRSRRPLGGRRGGRNRVVGLVEAAPGQREHVVQRGLCLPARRADLHDVAAQGTESRHAAEAAGRDRAAPRGRVPQRTVASSRRTSPTSRAAGRACRPCAFSTVKVAETVGPASAPASSAMPAGAR